MNIRKKIAPQIAPALLTLVGGGCFLINATDESDTYKYALNGLGGAFVLIGLSILFYNSKRCCTQMNQGHSIQQNEARMRDKSASSSFSDDERKVAFSLFYPRTTSTSFSTIVTQDDSTISLSQSLLPLQSENNFSASPNYD